MTLDLMRYPPAWCSPKTPRETPASLTNTTQEATPANSVQFQTLARSRPHPKSIPFRFFEVTEVTLLSPLLALGTPELETSPSGH